MNPQRLYLDILSDGTVVPAALHRGAWTYAARHHDAQLVKLLVGRADAPLDLLAEYAASTDPLVRATYLSRPDLTEAERARCLRGEKRAKVLRDLAFSTTSPAVLDECIARFRERPSRMLAEAIIGRVRDFTSDPDLLERALTVQDSNPGIIQLPALVATLAALGPDRANRMLATVSHAQLVEALVRFEGLDVDVVIAATKRAVSHVTRTDARGIVSAAASGCQGDPDSLAKLRAALEPVISSPWPAAGPARSWSGSYRGATSHTPATPATHGPGGAQAPAGELSSPVPSSGDAWSADPARRSQAITALTAWLDRDDMQPPVPTLAPKLLSALLQNVALSAAELDQVSALTSACLAAATRHPEAAWLLDDLGDVDVLTLWPARTDLHLLWQTFFPFEVFNQHGWRGFDGGRRAGHLLRQWSTEPDLSALVHTAARDLALDPQVVIDNLPWDQVVATWSSGDHWRRAGQLRAAAARVMASHLGDSADAWETFHALQEEFTGTLPDLCTAVIAATSAHQTT